MHALLLIIFLIVALILILLIMLQQNKGIDMITDSFNISSSLGFVRMYASGNFITHITAIFGALFFFLSLLLGNISYKYSQTIIVKDQMQRSQAVEADIDNSLELFNNVN